jgi:inner membrane transporter RhtA
MFSFQVGASIAKHLMPVVGAPATTAMRVGLSAVMVAVLQRAWRRVPSRSAWPMIVAYGAALGVMNASFYLAINRIPLGIAVALEFTGPLGVAVAHSRRAVHFVWIGLAVAGLIPLLPIVPTGRGLDPVGVLWALSAGVCWAGYIIFGQKAGRAHGPTTPSWGLLVAALIVVPIGIAEAPRGAVTWSVVPLGVAVAVFSSALPYTLEMAALTRLSRRAYGTLMSFDPAAAALVGFIALGERLTVVQWMAVTCVVVASAGTVGTDDGS